MRLGRPRRDQAGDMRDVRRRVESRIEALDVPEPFDIEVLCERVAEREGRPIELRPIHEDEPTMPSGMWLQLPSRDVILYEASASTPHREMIIAHELGHLVANHPCDTRLLETYRARVMPALSLNPDLIKRVLGRVSYLTEPEQEAELFAWLLLSSVRTRHRSTRDVPPDMGDPVARVTALLGPAA